MEKRSLWINHLFETCWSTKFVTIPKFLFSYNRNFQMSYWQYFRKLINKRNKICKTKTRNKTFQKKRSEISYIMKQIDCLKVSKSHWNVYGKLHIKMYDTKKSSKSTPIYWENSVYFMSRNHLSINIDKNL